MKKICFVQNLSSLFLFICLLSAAPHISSVWAASRDLDYWEAIEKKSEVSFDDGLISVLLLLDKSIPDSFEKRLRFFKDNRWLPAGLQKKDSDHLSKGEISLLLVKTLNLRGSFLFFLFGTERYALRLLVYHNLIRPLSSEWEKLSGEELMELIRLANQLKESSARSR